MFLKRIATFSIVLAYLLFSIGVYANVHYCAGEIESTNLSLIQSTAQHTCDDEETMDDDCCKNETHKISIKEPHVKEAFKYAFVAQLVDGSLSKPTIFFWANAYKWALPSVVSYEKIKPPPFTLGEHLLSFNSIQEVYCVYRI